MTVEDHYLLESTLGEIMAGTEESIRGWLFSVYIARGKIDSAIEESTSDRGILTHTLPYLIPYQQKAYLDCCKVQLGRIAPV